MPTVAVKVTELTGHDQDTKQGILTILPQVGQNCLIYLGGSQYLRIHQVKGWIGPAEGDYIILFDGEGKTFRVEVFASSNQFL